MQSVACPISPKYTPYPVDCGIHIRQRIEAAWSAVSSGKASGGNGNGGNGFGHDSGKEIILKDCGV